MDIPLMRPLYAAMQPAWHPEMDYENLLIRNK